MFTNDKFSFFLDPYSLNLTKLTPDMWDFG